MIDSQVKYEEILNGIRNQKDDVKNACEHLRRLNDLPAPDDLPGNLGHEKRRLLVEIRNLLEKSFHQRQRDALDSYTHRDKSLEERRNALGDVLRLACDEAELTPHPDVQARYDLLSDENAWPDEKLTLFIEHVRYRLENEQSDFIDVLHSWLQKTRDQIDVIKARIGPHSVQIEDLSDLREDVDRHYRRTLDFVQMKDSLGTLHKEYVLALYEYEKAAVNGHDSKIVRFDGMHLEGPISSVLPLLRKEYALAALEIAGHELELATGLQLAEWVQGNRRLSSDYSPTEISRLLRKGLINLDPRLKESTDYQDIPFEYVGSGLEDMIPAGKYPVIPRAISIPEQDPRRDQFTQTLNALKEALDLVNQMQKLWANANRTLVEMYEAKRIYPRQELLRWIEEAETQQKERLRRRWQELEKKRLYELNEETLKQAEKLFNESPLSHYDEANAEHSQFVKETQSKISDLHDRWTVFDERREKLSKFVLEGESENIGDDVDQLAKLVDDINRYKDMFEQIDPELRARITKIATKYDGLVGSKERLSNIQQDYNYALLTPDDPGPWQAIVDRTKDHYQGQLPPEGEDRTLWQKGRVIYLESQARVYLSEAKALPYFRAGMDSKESRKGKLEAARRELQLVQSIDPTRVGIDDMLKRINEDVEKTEEEETKHQEISEIADQIKPLYTSQDFLNRNYPEAYNKLGGYDQKASELRQTILTKWKDDIADQFQVVMSGQYDDSDSKASIIKHILYLADELSDVGVLPRQYEFDLWRENVELDDYRSQQYAAPARPDSIFGLPLQHADYVSWMQKLERVSRQSDEYLMVKVYHSAAGIEQQYPDHADCITELGETVKQLQDPKQRAILLDMLLYARQKRLLDLLQNRDPVSSEEINAVFTAMNEGHALLRLSDESSPLPLLWQYRVRMLQSCLRANETLGGNYYDPEQASMVRAFEEVEQLKKAIPESNQFRNAWVVRRIKEMKNTCESFERTNLSAVQATVVDAMRRAIPSNDLPMLLEYAFILKRRGNDQADATEHVIGQIAQQIKTVSELLTNRIEKIVTNTLPGSIEEAEKQMQALDEQAAQINTGLTNINLAKVDKDNFNTIANRAKTLASELRNLRQAYDEARGHLAGMIKGDASYLRGREWNDGLYRNDCDKASNAFQTLVDRSGLQKDSFAGPPDDLNSLKIIHENVSTEMKEIARRLKDLQNALRKSPSEDKRPTEYYLEAQKHLEEVQERSNTIAMLVETSGVFSSPYPEFKLPTSWLSLPLSHPLRDLLNRLRMQNSKQLVALSEYSEALAKLIEHSDLWEKWIDAVAKGFDTFQTEKQGWQRWYDYMYNLNMQVFNESVPDKLPDDVFSYYERLLAFMEETPDPISEKKLGDFEKILNQLLQKSPEDTTSLAIVNYYKNELESITTEMPGNSDSPVDIHQFLQQQAQDWQEKITTIRLSHQKYQQYCGALEEVIRQAKENERSVRGGWFGGGVAKEKKDAYQAQIKEYKAQQKKFGCQG